MNEITLDLVKSQLSPAHARMANQTVIDEINKLVDNPDYGEEFLDSYLTHLEVLKAVPRSTTDQYLNAIKFFSLVEANHSFKDAYIKVFPERYKRRKEKNPESADDSICGEASRYNSSVLVNRIRDVAAIPVQLVHRPLLNEAILEQAKLMRNAKSEMVRQKAAACLITELKPAEDHTLNINVKDGSSSVIEELRKATEQLASEEFRSVAAGVPMKDIAERNIIEGEYTEDSDGS